ncbi:hypothetical protein Glaag_1748 [Glaciecola sp. 4H-3-7+YE-5]|nr:hypothetical protein Glaag_1748 [Glaciecola sp. 4H-3-7+YE-5]
MIAVLTGDLVDSTAMPLEDYQLAVGIMEKYLAKCQARFSTQGEIYRGDSLQLIFKQPQHAMRAAIELRSLLFCAENTQQPLGITLSIGLGEQLIDGNKPSVSQGSAFTLSGRGLDNTPSGHISLHHESTAFYDALVLATKFLDSVLYSHTQKQAQVLYHYLSMDFPTHTQLAKALSTSQQNVTKHLARIGADLIKDYVVFFEEKLTKESE